MLSYLEGTFIRSRLKIVHWLGIGIFVLFFFMLFYLQRVFSIDTLAAQYLFLVMGGLLTMSYMTLLSNTSTVPITPGIVLYALTGLCALVVWATGMFQSPFIVLFVIFIIVVVQLYGYVHGLGISLVAFFCLVVLYGLMANGVLIEYSLLYYKDAGLVYQPPMVLVINGLLYVVLFLFTVFATSSARVFLFRPSEKHQMSSTIHEQIVRELPMGILTIDPSLVILGGNPAASQQFYFGDPPVSLRQYMGISKKAIKKKLDVLAASCEEEEVAWHSVGSPTMHVLMSVRKVEADKKEEGLYLLFLREAAE